MTEAKPLVMCVQKHTFNPASLSDQIAYKATLQVNKALYGVQHRRIDYKRPKAFNQSCQWVGRIKSGGGCRKYF